jgi:hypothetical protein
MTVVRTPTSDFPTTARIAMSLNVDACETLIAERLAN